MTLDPLTSALIGLALAAVCVCVGVGPSLVAIARGLRRRYFGPRPSADAGQNETT